MSEHFITLIPTIPDFVPSPELLSKAKDLFAGFLPGARLIEATLTDEIRFVDQGENFECVRCPRCALELETGWWQQEMDRSNKSTFRQLDVVTPCCGFATSLNDLNYRWPAGFSRFCLSARDPDQKEISAEQLKQLEQLLDTPLRQIWVHY